MPDVTINGQSVQAEEGETILALAKRLGVFIPTLCHHKKLHPFGACRICLVEVEPGNRLVPACTSKVFNNMAVLTDSPMAVRARKMNLELLLARHPSDCLVCEKGGECQLQDVAFAIESSGRFGAGKQNRITEIFGVTPLDYRLDDTRAIIERDMNKCILCKRCIRVCHDVQGVGAISFANRGYKMELGAFYGRALDCEFCGQCVDICPVGALVNKLYKYRARRWELTPVDSVCPYCGCGCALSLNVKGGGTLIKISAREGGGNEGNLCARGRYGFDFIGSEKRLSAPLVRQEGELRPVEWDDALDLTAARLREIRDKHGADKIAAIGSARCSNEENYLLQKMMRAAVGTPHLDSSVRLEHGPALEAISEALGWPAACDSMENLAQCEAIMLVGANVTETNPIIGLHIKKAVREGKASLLLVESEKTKMDAFAALSLRPRKGTEVALINGLARVLLAQKLIDSSFIEACTEGFADFAASLKKYSPEYVEGVTGVPREDIISAAEMYGAAGPAAIYFGAELSQAPQGKEAARALVNISLMTANIGKAGGGVNPLRVQNNVQGSCDMGMLPGYLPGYRRVGDEVARREVESLWGARLPEGSGMNLPEILKAVEKGRVKALYIMGENPILAVPDQEKLKDILSGLEFLAVQDIFLTETARLADVVLPGTSFAEKDGTFTSGERRVQRIRKALAPVGESRPDWQILADLSMRLGYNMAHCQNPARIMKEIAEAAPVYRGIDYERLEGGGLMWPCPDKDSPGSAVLYKPWPRGAKARFSAVDFVPAGEGAKYPYLVTAGKFHSGTMSRYSDALVEIRMVY